METLKIMKKLKLLKGFYLTKKEFLKNLKNIDGNRIYGSKKNVIDEILSDFRQCYFSTKKKIKKGESWLSPDVYGFMRCAYRLELYEVLSPENSMGFKEECKKNIEEINSIN